jgi:NAD(P)-dependent dehydrogenase (short-subunit alcohol dehydrogenase family)
VLVLDDAPEFARTLALALGRHGVVADIGTVADADGAGGVVVTLGLGGAEAGKRLHTQVLMQVKALGPGLKARGAGLVLLQTGVWSAGLGGLAKTAAIEWPGAAVRVLEVQAEGEQAANRVAGELLAGGETAEVRLSPEARDVPVLRRWSPAHRVGSAAVPGRGDVFLVTGGARGVTADCVVALARASRAGFALLGRSRLTPWPEGVARGLDLSGLRGALAQKAKREGVALRPAEIDRQARAALAGAEIADTLERVREAGGRAVYLSADVGDRVALDGALAALRAQLGEVSGLIHGAGVLADKAILDKTPEQVEAVFGPKVDGLAHILDALGTARLRTVALFSSAAARYGNAGQADYAMANEVLNAVARDLKAQDPARAVVAFNWGPWDGGMVDGALAAHFARAGIGLIDRRGGAEFFARTLMMGAQAPVEVAVGAALGAGHG